MKTSFRMTRGQALATVLLASTMVMCPSGARADDASGGIFALRNQNPFLQVYGLPTFQPAALAAPGITAWNLSLDLANHADFGESDVENFSIDGETYFLTLSMRRRVRDKLELGFDLLLVSHADGFMDEGIEGWHDMFGMSNTKRQGPSNELTFLYRRDGEDLYRLDSPAAGVGDIQLTAAVPLRGREFSGPQLTIRSSLKLPTGEPDKLLGSGAADFSVSLHIAGTRSIWGRPLEYGGFAGGLLLGDGDVLPTLQNNAVPFAGAFVSWRWSERFALAAQLSGQGPYFDSDVEELGGSSLQLATGAAFRTRGNLLLRIAVVEDVSANATTDFALHFSIRAGGG